MAIIGFSPISLSGSETTRADEVWSLSDAIFTRGFDETYPNLTRIYEVHHTNLYKHPYYNRKGMKERGYLKWLLETKHEGYQVVTLFDDPEIHNSITIPMESIISEYITFAGKEPVAYSTNTISYMLAHAILEDWDLIEIWGVDARSDTEYAYQKASIERLIGKAEGRGIKVWLHQDSMLLGRVKELYGLGFNQSMSRQMLENFKSGHMAIKAKLLNRRREIHKLEDRVSDRELEALNLSIRDHSTVIQVVQGFLDIIDGKIGIIEEEQTSDSEDGVSTDS